MKKATSCVGAEKFIKSLPWKLGHLTLHCRTAWQSHTSLFAGYASSEMQGPFTAQLQQKCSFCSLCIWFFLSYSPFLPGITIHLLYLIYRALFLEELSVEGVKHLTNSLRAAGEDQVNDQLWVLFGFFPSGMVSKCQGMTCCYCYS